MPHMAAAALAVTGGDSSDKLKSDSASALSSAAPSPSPSTASSKDDRQKIKGSGKDDGEKEMEEVIQNSETKKEGTTKTIDVESTPSATKDEV